MWSEPDHVRSRPPRAPSARAVLYTPLAAPAAAHARGGRRARHPQHELLAAGSAAQRQGQGQIFGLHNYQDVEQENVDGTRWLLATVPGQVWLTETGGILTFLPSFPRNAYRHDLAEYVFQLANRFKRGRGRRSVIATSWTQYTGAPAGARFDAGLTNPSGSKRKAYTTFKKYAARQPQ